MAYVRCLPSQSFSLSEIGKTSIAGADNFAIFDDIVSAIECSSSWNDSNAIDA